MLIRLYGRFFSVLVHKPIFTCLLLWEKVPLINDSVLDFGCTVQPPSQSVFIF